MCRALGVLSVLIPSVLLVLAVNTRSNRHAIVYPEQIDRLHGAVSGRCQVVASETYASFGRLANMSASMRCERSVGCACERDTDRLCYPEPIEDWDEDYWDGDRGMKVRGNADPELQGAVECPCEDPGQAAGMGFGKPHLNGAAMVIMRSDSLRQFDWSSFPCVHVHWFRGSNFGGRGRISDKVLSSGTAKDMDLETWVNAGEMNCIAIRADGVWRTDDLFINTNADGLTQVLETWLFRGRLFSGISFASAVALLATATCAFVFARRSSITPPLTP